MLIAARKRERCGSSVPGSASIGDFWVSLPKSPHHTEDDTLWYRRELAARRRAWRATVQQTLLLRYVRWADPILSGAVCIQNVPPELPRKIDYPARRINRPYLTLPPMELFAIERGRCICLMAAWGKIPSSPSSVPSEGAVSLPEKVDQCREFFMRDKSAQLGNTI